MDDDGESMEVTAQQAMLQAMIENAKSSTWEENLQNAAIAQKNFMIPPSHEKESRESVDLTKKILKRKSELEQIRKEKLKEKLNMEKDGNSNYFISPKSS